MVTLPTSSGEKTIMVHWRSWQTLCLSKNDGGLGFRGLINFKLALLSKQSWLVIQNPDAFWVEVLKARYLPTSDFMHATKGSRLLGHGLVLSTGVMQFSTVPKLKS